MFPVKTVTAGFSLQKHFQGDPTKAANTEGKHSWQNHLTADQNAPLTLRAQS